MDDARSAGHKQRQRRSPQAAHGRRAGKQGPDGQTGGGARKSSSSLKRGASGGVGPLIWSAAHQWTEANESESGSNSKLGVSALQRHMGGRGGDAVHHNHVAASLHSTSSVSMAGAPTLHHQLVQVQPAQAATAAPFAAPSQAHAAAHYYSSFAHANEQARIKSMSSAGRDAERAASAAAIYGAALQPPSQSHQPPQQVTPQQSSGPAVFVYGRCNGTLPSGRTSRSASSTASGRSLYAAAYVHPSAGLQASSSSSSPGVAVVEPVDCTEIEEWYDEDNADYMDYVRRWEEQKDAEAREAEDGAAMRVQRSLFFGLQLQQQKEAIAAAIDAADAHGDETASFAGVMSSRHHASSSSSSRQAEIDVGDSPSLPHSPHPLSPRQVNLSALTLRPVQHIAQSSMLAFMAELVAESAQIGASHARVSSGINSGSSGSFSSSSAHQARYSPIHFRPNTSLAAALALTTPADHIVSSRRSSRNYNSAPFAAAVTAATAAAHTQAPGHTHCVQVAPHGAHALEELRVVD